MLGNKMKTFPSCSQVLLLPSSSTLLKKKSIKGGRSRQKTKVRLGTNAKDGLANCTFFRTNETNRGRRGHNTIPPPAKRRLLAPKKEQHENLHDIRELRAAFTRPRPAFRGAIRRRPPPSASPPPAAPRRREKGKEDVSGREENNDLSAGSSLELPG